MKIHNPFKPAGASDYVDGLYVKDGRLINDRADGETGIAEASRLRQQMKKQYKIDCIADGIERAKMRMDHDKDIYEF
jgi:hypothetical protein|tara:strand:+ start:131 stop:361 length:231 start_codon:yes stop_codon:yes gene_type:complete